MQAFRRVLSLEPAFCVVGGMWKILRSNTTIDGSDTAHVRVNGDFDTVKQYRCGVIFKRPFFG